MPKIVLNKEKLFREMVSRGIYTWTALAADIGKKPVILSTALAYHSRHECHNTLLAICHLLDISPRKILEEKKKKNEKRKKK